MGGGHASFMHVRTYEKSKSIVKLIAMRFTSMLEKNTKKRCQAFISSQMNRSSVEKPWQWSINDLLTISWFISAQKVTECFNI